MTGGDDPDTARQRPGILDIGGLPIPAPEAYGVPAGRPLTVFFTGRDTTASLCRNLAAEPGLFERSEVVLVGQGVVAECPEEVTVVTGDADEQAARFGIPAPIDGGPRVGYAIVDANRQLRYRTLDPEVDSQFREVLTLLRGLT